MPTVRQRQDLPSPSNDLTVSDAELLARCRAGEVDAFEILYRQHSARIFALASRLAGSVDQGEDLLQEIFLQAYRKLDSFKGEAALGTWLYRLAANALTDRRRLTARDSAEPPPDVPDPHESGEIERHAMLFQLVERLPDLQRQVIEMRFVDGRSIHEVATALDRSDGAIKQLQLRALDNLRKGMGGRHG